MSFIISRGLRIEARNAMKDLFNAFKRDIPIRFYKVATETVSVFDPNYNSDYDESSESSTKTQTAQYQDFYARIWYEDKQEFASFIEGGSELGVKVKQYYNRIKIQVEPDAFAYLETTVQYEILSEIYKPETSWRRIGILGEFQFYEIILKRVN